jgi:3-oxoacyl-[acyl-carrier protein] reductase
VTTLSPGPTATELFITGKSDALVNGIKSANPYGRLGEPEDMSGAIDSILGAGKWLNGANIRANGGSSV